MELPERSGETRPAGELMSDDAALALLEGGEPSGEDGPPPGVPQRRQAAPPASAAGESEPEVEAPVERPTDDDSALRKLAEQTAAARKADDEREPPPPDEKTARARNEELILARRAVARFGAPKEVVDSMPEEQLLAWGKRATEMQAGIDAMRARNAQAPAQQNTAPQDTQPAAKPTETPRTQAADSAASAPAGGAYEANLKTAATQLADVLGVDAKDGQVIESVLRSITQPLRDEITARDSRDGSRVDRDKARDAALYELAVRDSMRRLEGAFPQLAEAEARKDVRGKFDELVASGRYSNPDDAMEDASKIVLFAPSMQAAVAQASKVARAKERGSVTVPSQRAAQPRALTPSEIEDRELDMLENGYTPAEVESSKALGW